MLLFVHFHNAKVESIIQKQEFQFLQARFYTSVTQWFTIINKRFCLALCSRWLNFAENPLQNVIQENPPEHTAVNPPPQ